MTIEKVCFVDLEDIKELRLTCKTCGYSSTLPLGALSNFATLIERGCVACNKDFDIRRGTDEWNRILGFVDNLDRVETSLQGRRLKISMRVDCEPMQSVSQKS